MDFSPPIASRRALLVRLTAATATLAAAPLALARTALAARIERIANQVLAVARAGGSKSAFKRLLYRHAALDSAAMFALGKWRRKLPASKRRTYVRLYAELIASLFEKYAGSLAGKSYRVTKENGRMVKGKIVYSNGATSPVSWRMRGSRIFDVQVQGIWLGVFMRNDFTGVLNRSSGDFDALLKHMRRS